MRIENTSLSQPIQPMLLAQNTQRNSGLQGVGFLPLIPLAISAFAPSGDGTSTGSSPSGILGDIKNFFGGIFGGDPNKDAFDHQRQALWDQFKTIVDLKNTYTAGSLTRDQLQKFIANVQSIIAAHNALYQQYRTKIDAAWIDPRYHDFADFFQKVLLSWQQELSQMGGILSSLTGGQPLLAGMDATTMLLLGGLAYMLFRK